MNYKKNITFSIILIIISLSLINSVLAISAYGNPIKKDSYQISRSQVFREISQGEIVKENIIITNLKDTPMKIYLTPSSEVKDILELTEVGGLIEPHNSTEILFNILGKKVKNYFGKITLSNDINEEIPVNITVLNGTTKPKILLELSPVNTQSYLGGDILIKLNIINLKEENNIGNVSFVYTLNGEDNSSFILLNETTNIKNSYQTIKRLKVPALVKKGFYVVKIESRNNNDFQTASSEIEIVQSIWTILIFGVIPVWMLAIGIGVILFGLTIWYIIRKRIEKNKKYRMQIDFKTLPIKTERSLTLGKIAETNRTAYFDVDALTTHGVVAGATGGGKSIAAQVLVEEALINKIAVIVFDPTAQWSGMLRKCDDKKMFTYYPKFGLKESDARAFPGNIRQIVNERQKIDIKKYMVPGNIQIFTMNKLTPPQIDTFVASVVASVFSSDPQEYPSLRVLLVFDEVHRLLPKFGGSGKGFLQIERACREFRKWGFGVMLVSQVLSDFVGEIKANINTEIQMRTRDESDLGRLQTKYGPDFLQSLVKASVGVGMFVNAKYNRGQPYFINFRPILHNTKRLSDDILDKYNSYGEIIDDLEYQLKQLEELKIDIFDLKMELKLVKDKLTSGNFTVVDIYLEELGPRVRDKWTAIKKKPKKLEIELIDENIITKSVNAAQQTREGWKDETKK